MRKIILYLAVLCIFFAPVQSFAADLPENQDTVIQVKNPNFENAKMQIIEELNLSKGQQKKAEKIYAKAKEKIVVLNNKINEKQQEARAIKLSRIDTRTQLERLIKINNEVDILYQTRDKIHNGAMRKFDNILNKNQKKIWNDIKLQGARFFPDIESMI